MKNTALSKSKYTKFCQCPKALWLGKNKPEEATIDAGVEARFAEGNVIDDRTANGASEFGDNLIQFGSERYPDWESVLAKLLPAENSK